MTQPPKPVTCGPLCRPVLVVCFQTDGGILADDQGPLRFPAGPGDIAQALREFDAEQHEAFREALTDEERADVNLTVDVAEAKRAEARAREAEAHARDASERAEVALRDLQRASDTLRAWSRVVEAAKRWRREDMTTEEHDLAGLALDHAVDALLAEAPKQQCAHKVDGMRCTKEAGHPYAHRAHWDTHAQRAETDFTTETAEATDTPEQGDAVAGKPPTSAHIARLKGAGTP